LDTVLLREVRALRDQLRLALDRHERVAS
jgi:hypothetical protein